MRSIRAPLNPRIFLPEQQRALMKATFEACTLFAGGLLLTEDPARMRSAVAAHVLTQYKWGQEGEA